MLQIGESWQGCRFAYASCVTKATAFVGAAAPSPSLPLPVLPARHSWQSDNPPLGFTFLFCLLPQSCHRWRETFPTREEEGINPEWSITEIEGRKRDLSTQASRDAGHLPMVSQALSPHASSLGCRFGEALVVANLNKWLVPTVWKSPTVSHQLWH